MNEPIEIRVWVIGQNEPTVFTVKKCEAFKKKAAAVFVKGLMTEAVKPARKRVKFFGSNGTYINPRFITKITSSVPLNDCDMGKMVK